MTLLKSSLQLVSKEKNSKIHFNIIVTADDVTNHKPEPGTFLKCAGLMGIVPKYCQVFEDGKPGMDAACKAGMIVTDVRKFY